MNHTNKEEIIFFYVLRAVLDVFLLKKINK